MKILILWGSCSHMIWDTWPIRWGGGETCFNVPYQTLLRFYYQYNEIKCPQSQSQSQGQAFRFWHSWCSPHYLWVHISCYSNIASLYLISLSHVPSFIAKRILLFWFESMLYWYRSVRSVPLSPLTALYSVCRMVQTACCTYYMTT